MTALQPSTTARDEQLFSATRGLCHTCGVLCDAKIVFRGERVYLVKHCGEHGRSEALISSDKQWYLRSLAYIKPGTDPFERSVSEFRGCPSLSCGLCPAHQQHTCVPIFELTTECDMRCPICLVGEGGHEHRTLDEIDAMTERLLRCEGTVNMLNLSGGEPTRHPRFLEIVDRLQARPEIGILSVSTNGLRLARDEALLDALCERDVVLSLQLDGFTSETTERLRGRADLGPLKRRVIERVLARGGKLSLTVTLAKGINEHELPELLSLLFVHDQVLSMMVQPLAHTGRAPTNYTFDPLDVLTIPDVVRLLADSSAGVLTQEDFSPLPCSHPTCFALTYLMKTEGGELVPLPRVVETESYLDIIKNQALLSTDSDTLLQVRDSLYALWSSDGIFPHREPVLRTVRNILLELNALGGRPEHSEVLTLGTRHVKSIFIHHFMDRFTFDQSRVIKCCNHYPQPDGRLLPACVRNNML